MEEINPIDAPEVRKALLAAGVSQQTLWQWRKRGVPLDRCMPLETETNQIATRKILRPADWMVHWPELIEQSMRTRPEPEMQGQAVLTAGSALGYDGLVTVPSITSVPEAE
jgi:DNA-binding transcriptional regulator YdaS (Cro superfamily)